MDLNIHRGSVTITSTVYGPPHVSGGDVFRVVRYEFVDQAGSILTVHHFFPAEPTEEFAHA